MEAAAFELPIVMGPHVQNVDDIAGLFIEAEAMQMVSDADSLVQIIERLCTDEVFRGRMGSAAASVMRDNKGSLDRVLQLIEDHYDQRNEAQ